MKLPGTLAVVALLAAGCREDMHDSPRFEPMEASTAFADGRSDRRAPEGTVPRGRLEDDDHLFRGTGPDGPAATFPFRLGAADLARGRERFEIFCVPCHDPAGTGRGLVVRRGFPEPPSFHTDRLREAPPGHVFQVVGSGLGDMPAFADRIPVEDRWRIAAYVRALQRSRRATTGDLPPEERARLEAAR